MSLMLTLNRMAKDIDHKYSKVNMGGCCVIASYVADKLRDVIPNIKVTVLDGGDEVIDDKFRANMEDCHDGREWNNAGIWFYHIIVTFEEDGIEWSWDTEHGLVPLKELLLDWSGVDIIGNLEIDEALSISHSKIWNNSFDRNQIPGIKSTIRKHLRQLAA